MKYWLNAVKILGWFLSIIIITGIATSSVYAMTQGQKSIGDIGADITWYDFGDYTHYYINEELETGFYTLTMSNDNVSKRGFANAKGELVVEPDPFDSISSSVYIDSKGLKSIDGKAYSEVGSFLDGYATVTLKSNSKKGVIDKNGSLIFEDKEGKYKDFRFLGSGIFSAEISENNYDFLDYAGTPLTESHYTNDWLREVSEDTISVSKDGKYGFLDLSGREIVPLIYDNAYYFSEGLAAVCKDGKWGFADKTGTEVVLPRFDNARSFNGSLAAVSAGDKWGFIDKAGKIIRSAMKPTAIPVSDILKFPRVIPV